MEKTNKQKPAYYVFCGIDGVLWDLPYGQLIHGPYLSAIDNPVLKKESVEALNLLLKSLEQTHDTKLVITSQRRSDLASCATYLSSNRLDYDKPLYATRFTEGLRGEKIIDFMQKENREPQVAITLGDKLMEILGKTKTNGNFSNYVVLEDNQRVIKKHIPAERTIKTDFNKSSLTTKQVVEYLSSNELSVDENYLSQISGGRQPE